MARIRKSTYDQIKALDEQIDKINAKLSLLQQARKELIVKQQEEEIGELYSFLKDNNLTTSDIYKMIEESNNTEQKSA